LSRPSVQLALLLIHQERRLHESIGLLPDAEFSKDYKNWGVSEKPWIEMTNGALVAKIVDLSLRVRDAFQKANKLSLLS
jgi:hypothetical protein